MKNSTNSSLPSFWFVAYVRSCQERRLASFLASGGIEYYLPIQMERRRWSDRIKLVEKLVLPGMIFIHTDEIARQELLKDNPLISRFMTNGPYKPVVVPDSQMEEFRFVVENSSEKVSVSSRNFAAGEKIEVISGPLKGLVSEITAISGVSYLLIRLDMLGAAMVKIDAGCVKKI